MRLRCYYRSGLALELSLIVIEPILLVSELGVGCTIGYDSLLPFKYRIEYLIAATYSSCLSLR